MSTLTLSEIEFTLELVDNIVYDNGKIRYIEHE